MRGDADGAEQLARDMLSLGLETGQPDALAAFGATLANIRWHQGRTEELIPILAQAAADNPGLPAFQAAHGVMLCESGQLEPARELLVRAAAENFYASAVDHTWLTGTALWGDVAATVGDTDAAAVLYERLAPFEGQGVASLVTFAGTVAMYLARLAATLGRADALRHFERADSQLRALEAPFFHARNQVEWARQLASTRADHDRVHARELLSEAIATARAYGCAGVERRAAALSSDLS
jgi:hypothetical protein